MPQQSSKGGLRGGITMKQTFEPEIEIPDNDFEAAVIYLAVMAYPELGAGQIGQRGSRFANALVNYCLWSARQSRGLRWLRERRNDESFTAPQKRDFEGLLQRGFRRIRRRTAAYSIFGTQLLTGFFEVGRIGAEAVKTGRPKDAFVSTGQGQFGPTKSEVWQSAMPSIRKVIRANEEKWADRLALNNTGRPSDPDQKVKDLYERAFLSSVPVLHMAHGLETILDEASKSISGWDQREPFSALLMNPEKWVWQALAEAERWRCASRLGIDPFGPYDQIRLIIPKTET
jgi:hypothetical protein